MPHFILHVGRCKPKKENHFLPCYKDEFTCTLHLSTVWLRPPVVVLHYWLVSKPEVAMVNKLQFSLQISECSTHQ